MLDGLLPAMRETVVLTLDSTIVVENRVRTRTATGGSAYSWVPWGSTPGRFMATSNKELEFASKMGIAATHVAVLPHDTVIAVDDRVVVDGVAYSVNGVMVHTIPVLVKVLCARVEE